MSLDFNKKKWKEEKKEKEENKEKDNEEEKHTTLYVIYKF